MKVKRGLVSRFLVFMLTLIMSLGCLTVSAVTPKEAYETLKKACMDGTYLVAGIDYSSADYTYNCGGGGYLTYKELTYGVGGTSTEAFFNEAQFKTLTGAGKQDFLQDMLHLANTMAEYNETGKDSSGVSTDTVNEMLRVIQNKSGMGSQLLATLMSETKPDYATAQRMYAPFSGVVGTILGLISILILSLLGVTMGLDIAYIVIPPVQLFFGGQEGGNGDGKKGMSGWISQEAKKAVEYANGGSNGQGGSGEYKAAIGVYLKYRWLGLVILGICLLYLVQGEIYNFVAWFIDLFSGFLGF